MIERLHGQFFNEPTNAFHFDAVENNQDEHAKRHRQGDVHVGRRNHAQCWQAENVFADIRKQVDWQRSIRFIRKTQTNTVSASGAITLFLPWYMSLTLPWTKPMIISMKVWNFLVRRWSLS